MIIVIALRRIGQSLFEFLFFFFKQKTRRIEIIYIRKIERIIFRFFLFFEEIEDHYWE